MHEKAQLLLHLSLDQQPVFSWPQIANKLRGCINGPSMDMPWTRVAEPRKVHCYSQDYTATNYTTLPQTLYLTETHFVLSLYCKPTVWIQSLDRPQDAFRRLEVPAVGDDNNLIRQCDRPSRVNFESNQMSSVFYLFSWSCMEKQAETLAMHFRKHGAIVGWTTRQAPHD